MTSSLTLLQSLNFADFFLLFYHRMKARNKLMMMKGVDNWVTWLLVIFLVKLTGVQIKNCTVNALANAAGRNACKSPGTDGRTDGRSINFCALALLIGISCWCLRCAVRLAFVRRRHVSGAALITRSAMRSSSTTATSAGQTSTRTDSRESILSSKNTRQ